MLGAAALGATGDLRGPKGEGGYAPVVLMVAIIAGSYTFFLGPQLLRQDLRSDLPNADILKTYPLAGWQIILGELLTPTAILSGLLWFSILAAVWALARMGGEPRPFELADRLIIAACLAVIVPPLCALQLLIPNAAAVLFPGWFQSMRTRGGGIEMMGQRLIFVFGQLLAVVVAILPAALLAAAVFISGSILVLVWILGDGGSRNNSRACRGCGLAAGDTVGRAVVRSVVAGPTVRKARLEP